MKIPFKFGLLTLGLAAALGVTFGITEANADPAGYHGEKSCPLEDLY